ncbi:MAG: hypothetical protein KF773_28045 [Deltaproteobacteria bacterium]|nr:hypothetical protein [Deltaproteobacteria bacterium]MCW5803291.1 hypothetical protein [Deltaproteobacteria bacterium]
MKKLITLLGFAVVAVALGGCELYLGESGGDNWSYCGSDGFYTCKGDNCSWASATCPSGGNTPGADCATHEDCAAGCFCGAGGKCEEAGFCKDNADCADGLHCDDRSSCIPDSCSAATACEDPTDACDGGNCVAMSCAAADATVCTAGNTTTMPSCGEGTVPLTFKGCYSPTNVCQTISLCDVAPPCQVLVHEADCLRATERTDGGACGAVYNGVNCRNPTSGASCTSPGANCVCDSFTFNGCISLAP